MLEEIWDMLCSIFSLVVDYFTNLANALPIVLGANVQAWSLLATIPGYFAAFAVVAITVMVLMRLLGGNNS